MQDLYNVLGVAANATKSEIKKAFKSKAMQLHPDRGGDSDEFKIIEKAHRILSDDDKRKKYDTTGDTGTVKTLEDKAVDVLSQMFNEVVSKGNFKVDIVNYVHTILTNNKNRLEQNLCKLDVKQATLNKQLGRVISTGEHNNFEAVLNNVIDSAKNQTDEIKENLTIVLKAEELLADYSDEKPPAEVNQSFTFYNNTMG